MAGWLHIVLTSLWIVHLNAKGRFKKINLRPNLKNLSRGSNFVGSHKLALNFSRFAGAQLKPVLGDIRRGRLKFIKFGH